MIKGLLKGVTVLATLLFSLPAVSQTTEEVLSTHLSAVGGQKAFDSLSTLVITGKINNGESEVFFTEWIIKGVGSRREIQRGETKITQVFSTTKNWEINPDLGTTQPRIYDSAIALSNAYRYSVVSPFFYTRQQKKIASLFSLEMIDTTDCYRMRIFDIKGKESLWYISIASGLLYKSVTYEASDDGELEIETLYSDYITIPFGIKMAQKQIRKAGEQEITTTLLKTEVNKKMDPTIFDLPKK